jgi:hypothetical protein
MTSPYFLSVIVHCIILFTFFSLPGGGSLYKLKLQKEREGTLAAFCTYVESTLGFNIIFEPHIS